MSKRPSINLENCPYITSRQTTPGFGLGSYNVENIFVLNKAHALFTPW